MPRLLVLTTSRDDGGAESHLRMSTRAVAGCGYVVTVALPNHPATARLRQDLLSRGCKVLIRGFGRQSDSKMGTVASVAMDALDAVRTIIRDRPRVILLNLPTPEASPGAMIISALAPVRSTVLFHLVRDDLSVTWKRRQLYRLCARFGQRWVCVSDSNRRVLASAFDVDTTRIAVVHNGTDIQPATAARETVRGEFGLSSASTMVLTSGRLAPQKDHSVILDSLRHLSHDDGLVFVWAGDGPLRQQLEERIHRESLQQRVRVLGRRTDVPRLLAAADLFLLPSRDEGGPPLALLEAFAAGVPSIVSDVGALTEVVRERENGLVFRGRDPVDLARVLAWGLRHRDHLALMAATAGEEVRADYSVEAMLAGLLTQILPSDR